MLNGIWKRLDGKEELNARLLTQLPPIAASFQLWQLWQQDDNDADDDSEDHYCVSSLLLAVQQYQSGPASKFLRDEDSQQRFK